MPDTCKQIVEMYNEPFYKKPGSFRFLVFITDKCNYNCEYCYNHFPRTGIDLNLDLVYDFITKVIFEKMGKKFLHLDLIGGETTLHPNLLNFCEKISKFNNIFTTVYSNFSKPFEYYKKLIDNKVHLLLSWHSCCDNEEYKVKFKKFLKYEIENMLTLSVMYEHNNTKKCIQAFDWFSENFPNLKELEFSILDENENYKGKKYTPQQFSDFLKKSKRVKTPTTLLKYSDGTSEYVNDNFFFKDPKNTDFRHWMCNAGIDFLFLYFNGKVHPCDENDNTVLFDINKQKIEDFQPPIKPIFCKRDHCPCLFDLYKKKVFK